MNATHRAWWDDYRGIPYVDLGRTPDPGLDCWGLVRWVKREREGVELPSLAGYARADRSETIARESERWADVTDAPRPGDVAVFNTRGRADHVALIVAPGLMLHVVEGGVSDVVRMDHPLWRRRLASVWRYGMGTAGAAPGLVTLQSQAGDTVLSIIIRAGVDPERCVVSVAGKSLPRSMWGLCRPVAGAPVEMRRIMAGGGTKGLITSLAVMAVAWYAAPAVMGYAAGSAGWAAAGAAGSGWAVSAASAGLNIAGNLLASKIFPTRPPAGQQSQSAGAAAYSLQGGSNSATPYGAVPVVLGRYRYTPPLGAATYTEAEGQDAYLRMLLVWGYGPLQISNLRIGDTPIESYEEVEIETLEGSDDDSEESKSHLRQLYSQDVAQESVGGTLESVKISVASASRASNVMTVTTTDDHGLGLGDFVTLYSRTASYTTHETNADGEVVSTYHPEVIGEVASGFVSVVQSSKILKFPHNGQNGTVSAYSMAGWSYVTRTMDSYVDRIRVTLNFPQGLWGMSSDDGTAQPRQVRVSVAVRPASGGSWDEVSTKIHARAATLGRAWYNVDSDAALEEVYRWTRVSLSPTNAIIIKNGAFTASQNAEPSSTVLKRLQAENYGFDATYTRLPPLEVSHEPLYLVCVHGNDIVQVVDQRGSGNGGVTGCGLTYSGRRIQIAAGTVLRSQTESVFVAGTEKTAFSKNVDFFVPRDRYEVRVARISANVQSDDRTFDDCVLSTITGYANNRPVVFDKPLAMTAIKIRASNQISGQVDGITGTVQSVCKDWSASTSSWVERPTRNPASLYRWVLQHPANARKVPDSRIDLDALQDWHVYCKQNSFTFDGVVTSQRSIDDQLRDIAAAGRASPTWINGRRSIVVDKLRSGYAAYFTPENSWGLEAVRSLPKLPHGWRVRFANAEKSYQPDERIVYADGYSAANATLLEGLELPGVTSPELVHKHGRYHFAQLKLRPETYTLNTDWEHLVVTRGDLVRVAHYVTMWGLGTARITSLSGRQLTLSDDLPFAAGVTYQVRICMSDGSSAVKNVQSKSQAGYYQSIVLTSDPPAGAGVGDKIMFGEALKEGVDLIITGIEPQDGHNARLTLVDYAPECQDSDTETVPAFDSHVTLPPAGLFQTISVAPVVRSVVSDERVMRRLAPGKYEYAIKVAFSSPKKLPRKVTQIQGRFDRVDGVQKWQVATSPVTAGFVALRGVDEGATYQFQLRFVDSDGRAGPWTPVQSHKIVGKTNRPTSVAGLQAAPSGARIKIQWAANREPDVEKYEVRTSLTGWGANDAGRVFYGAATSCFHVPDGVGAITYYVKARDGGGLWSKTPASVTYTYSAPSEPASLTASFSDTATTSAQVVLDWPDASPAFGVGDYVVYQAGAKIKTVKASTITLPADWVGSRTFGVSVRDALGAESAQRTLVVTMTLPGTPPAPVQDATAAVAGKTTVTLDWDPATRGTLAIAGYEVRQADSGWGGTGAVYRGSGSKAVIPGVSTTATTTWYIRAFDTEQHYSASSRVVTHDVTRPGNVGAVTVSRSGATLALAASGYSKPADFRVFEFQVGRAPADVPSSGDFWDDPDAVKIQTSAATTSVALTRFNTPRMSASGVTYRVAVRMIDTSGNTSAASAISSILVKTL